MHEGKTQGSFCSNKDEMNIGYPGIFNMKRSRRDLYSTTEALFVCLLGVRRKDSAHRGGRQDNKPLKRRGYWSCHVFDKGRYLGSLAAAQKTSVWFQDKSILSQVRKDSFSFWAFEMCSYDVNEFLLKFWFSSEQDIVQNKALFPEIQKLLERLQFTPVICAV